MSNGHHPSPTTVNVDVGFLKWLYSEVRAYDTHYSTVRSGISTVLISVMFLLTTRVETIVDGETTVSAGLIAIIVLMNAFTIYANLHFQRLTTACKLYQNEIESTFGTVDLSADDNPVMLDREMLAIREHIQTRFRETDLCTAMFVDRPAQMVIGGTAIYWLVMLVTLG